MRTRILDVLHARMATDKTLIFITADMGMGSVERFRDTYPDRFLNVGIAEQNMIGVAAGLCNAGFRPICYTVSNFLIHRVCEQLRNDIAAHGYPMILLGSTVGFDNAPLGMTHHMLDDWGVAKNLPGFDIYTAWGVDFAGMLMDRVLDGNTPTYIRIPKGSPPSIVRVLHEQKPILLVTYGPLAGECEKLAASNMADVLVLQKIHPVADLTYELTHYRHVFVAEDHFADTGLYASLTVQAASMPTHAHLHSIAPPKSYEPLCGASPQWFWRRYGLDAEGIKARIETLT